MEPPHRREPHGPFPHGEARGAAPAPLARRWIAHQRVRKIDHAQHPVGRDEDVAELAAYLISDAAGFITGQNFVIDGGMTKKMIYV